MPTSEQIEKAAQAMCLDVGENWFAKSCNETHSGNEPSEMRDGWRSLANVALSAAEGVKPREWEAFCDASYYDMWCVRPVGEAEFGKGFHLINGDEAKELARILAALQEGV